MHDHGRPLLRELSAACTAWRFSVVSACSADRRLFAQPCLSGKAAFFQSVHGDQPVFSMVMLMAALTTQRKNQGPNGRRTSYWWIVLARLRNVV